VDEHSLNKKTRRSPPLPKKMLGIIKHNVSLKPLSYLHVGGKTRHFFIARSVESMVSILSHWIKEQGKAGLKKIIVIGGTTNILFSDKTYDGLVVANKISFIRKTGHSTVFVGSGTSMSSLLKFCFKNKLVGLEWTNKLPGSVGGAVRGNAGCFGGEIKDTVQKVISIDIDCNGKIYLTTRSKKECQFGYRSSIFKKDNLGALSHVIVGVYFKLKKVPSIKKELEKAREIRKYRWTKHPMEFPSLGSTFKNVPVKKVPKKVLKTFSDKIKNDPFPILPVALLLDGINLKGVGIGGAKFSEKHPNFILNTGKARALDVKKLISLAKKRVKSKFGVSLEEEIEIIK